MSEKFQSLLQDAMTLDVAERREMIARLQGTLPHSGFASAEIEQAWIEEIELRDAAYERGEMKGLTLEEFRAKLDAGRGT